MSFEAGKISALLFDLDGTLIDSEEDIAQSANKLRLSKGLQALPTATIGSYVGEGVEALVRKLMGPEYEAELAALVEAFKSDYNQNCAVHTKLYPGVMQTLQALASRGYKMAVVTNKPERISGRILELLGVSSFFGCVIGGNSCPTKKPDPGPLFEACRRLGVDKASACMIGDSRVDIEAGKNAALPALGILGGIGDEALMHAAGPSLVLADFSKLEGVFQGAA